MRNFLFGQTFRAAYPNRSDVAAAFVVARGDNGQPYLVCYNDSDRLHAKEALPQGTDFMCEGVPFRVDNDTFALSVGPVTGC